MYGSDCSVPYRSERERRPLLACAFALLALFFFVSAWRFAAASGGIEGLTASALATSMLTISLALAGGLWRRSTVTDALGLMPGHIGPLRLGVVALGTVGLSHLCGELLRRTPLWDDSILQTVETALTGLTGEEWLFAAVGFVIAPAIGEELLFRGLTLRGLLSRLTPGGAILGSSILFGAVHLDPGQAIATSVLGVYLGTLAFASRSTRGAILCHMLNNGVALASVGLRVPTSVRPKHLQQPGACSWPALLLSRESAHSSACSDEDRRTRTHRPSSPTRPESPGALVAPPADRRETRRYVLEDGSMSEAVLILDDGELEDVAQVLSQENIPLSDCEAP